MSRTVVRWKPRSANSSLAAARSRSLVPPTNNCLKHSFHQGKPSIFCRAVTRWPLEEHPRAVRLAPFQRPGGAASGLLSPTRHASAPDPAHAPGRAGGGRMRSAPARAVARGTPRAAAQYLRLLHERYGDWPLALAAYNAGEHRVDRALARDPEASFWRLAERGYLPRISREYVPRFFAVVRVAGEREPTALGSAL